MKRSEYREKRIVHHEQAMGYYCRGGASAEGRTAVLRADLDIEAAEAAGVTWDPEEPEGFEAWWRGLGVSEHGLHTESVRRYCLLAWNACLARQEAQQRTIEAPVDPEVRRKKIEARIEAWADYQVSCGNKKVWRELWVAAGRGLLRNYIHLEGF